MMNAKHIASTLVTIAAAAAMFACVAPTVNAADTGTAVVSSRSFPKVTTVKKNILAESTATSTDDNSSWGDVESLDVPQTQSQAEKDAAARKAAEEQAAAQAQASQFSGYPYVYGGNTPSGWDCSGFVQYVYAQFGISLPHSSGAQAGVGIAVGSLAQAQPGDIVANGTHAAIYIGNGLVMNALSPGLGTQVTSTSVFSGGYSIRRVL